MSLNVRFKIIRSYIIKCFSRYKRLQTASKHIQKKLYYPKKFQKSIDIVDSTNPIVNTLKYLVNSVRYSCYEFLQSKTKKKNAFVFTT
jgi:hypothetical protein